MTRRGFLAGLLAGLMASGVFGAPGWSGMDAVQAQEPIRIGELNSYGRFPAFTVPYRKGWELAFEEINAAGGVLGHPLEVVSRDDGGSPADAVRVAEELVSRDGVDFLFGTFLSNIGLAVANFANQRQVLFLAAEPLTDAITMAKGNKYTFRLRPNTYMQTAMLVHEGAKLGKSRWAIVVPNYEYGQSAAANFKRLIAEQMPGAEVVVEQYPALGKIDAGATVQALLQAEPDAIFSALFGGDLAKFVREGDNRGLFDDREVLSLLTGEPEWLDILKDEAPEGWIVTGYPWYGVNTPQHNAFLEAYQARHDDYPRLGSVLGYTIGYAIKAALEKAGSTDTEAMIAALRGLSIMTPLGAMTIRASDHQGTMGAYVGRLAIEDDKGVMVDWYYADGAEFMFSEEEVASTRPAD